VLNGAHDSGLCVLQNTPAIVYTSRYLKPTISFCMYKAYELSLCSSYTYVSLYYGYLQAKWKEQIAYISTYICNDIYLLVGNQSVAAGSVLARGGLSPLRELHALVRVECCGESFSTAPYLSPSIAHSRAEIVFLCMLTVEYTRLCHISSAPVTAAHRALTLLFH
jgi:hypothetical protein